MDFTKADIDAADEAALEEILEICYKDLAKLCKVLFPERFRLPFTRLHYMIFELLNDTSKQQVVIAAPRGIGKTSIVGLGLMGKAILFRDCRFIPYVAKTETHAISQTENLKRKLLTSRNLIALFGSIRTKAFKDMDEAFSKKSWVASLPDDDVFKTLVLPRGVGQPVRGLLFDDYRPDLFQVDDLEDDRTIGNPDIRRATKEWFYGSLMGAISQAEDDNINWRIIYTDTVKHHDSLIEELLNSKDWDGLRLSICDENYKTMVPGFKSTESIKKLVSEHRDAGTLDVFAREYMCQPVSRENAKFKQELFKRYAENSPNFVEQRDNLRSVVIFDPSRTLAGNKTGMVCWGINVTTDAMFLREAIAERWHPEEVINQAFDMAVRNQSHIVAYENTGLNEWIDHMVRTQMISRGLHFELISLKGKRALHKSAEGIDLTEEKGKVGRSAVLLPFYRRGLVYHNVTCASIEIDLMSWPRPREWDRIDAMSYIIPIMEEYAMYFQPMGDDDDIYEFKDEFNAISDYGDNVENVAVGNFV